MYGIAGIPISLIMGSLPLYAISVAIFEDELAYLIMQGKPTKIIILFSLSLAQFFCNCYVYI